MDFTEKLKQQFGDKVILDQPLTEFTTLKIGGPAKAFIEANSQEELIEVLQFAKQEDIPYLVIGGGSNLLINDQGVDVLVIKNNISEIFSNDSHITVSSGTVLQDLVNYTIEHGLTGLQKMTGIPGTVGGAVYGNAGAYGQTISDHLVSVAAFSLSDSRSVTLTKDECNFDYRSSLFKQNKDLIILSATFELEKSDAETLEKESSEILSQRLIKYPAGIKCPGSFFKNIVASTLTHEQLAKVPPEKIVYGKLPAGSLLEMVGAKGDSEGGIEIADYHANLFVNDGTGTAQAFYDLAKKYWTKVKDEFGIELEPEVQLIDLRPFS